MPNRNCNMSQKRLEFFCIYSGTALPQTIWKKMVQLITWDDRISPNNHGKSMAIKNATIEDAGEIHLGEYTCEVSIHSINLTMNALPFFTVEPKSQTVTEGENVTFECKSFGIPEPDPV